MFRLAPTPSGRFLALGTILLAALALRLHNIGFGLPSIYDPDEPFFMLKALELLTNGTLNPHWFGHPGSTTIYLIALIDAAVVGVGLLGGAFGSTDEFARAAFANPAMLFMPARTAMAILAVLSVWLTYVVGRRLHGTAVGLIAAGLLTINGLHIAWSQVVRTDIHASVFMMASLLFAIRACEAGKLKDYLLAGVFAGFAIATKWPAASFFAAVFGAAAFRALTGKSTAQSAMANAVASLVALLVGIFVASPFIFIDWQTVLANVAGEVKSSHLSHTGGGFFENLRWYAWGPVRESVGTIGLLLIVGGVAASAARSRIARWTLIPATLCFLGVICSQGLVWSRWIVPVLPAFTILAAAAIVAVGEALAVATRTRRWALVAGTALVAAVPSAQGAIAQARERANDTRQRAAHWAIAHIPAGSSVVLEHLELGLRDQPWHFLFPLGKAGCVDAKRLLGSRIQSERIARVRQGSPIVDLGNVDAARIPSCRADFAILTYYDLYRAEPYSFPQEIDNYETLLAGGRTVALFAPRPGFSGGPTVRIVALQQQGSSVGQF